MYEDARRATRLQKAFVVLGIAVLSFNLRPAAVSIAPVLEELSRDLDLNGAEAGLLTTLPVLCFASVGALAPRLASRIGLHRITLLGLVMVTATLWLRVQVDNGWVFLLLSFLGLSGAATANVLLPSLVKLHFPHRIGLLTAIYSTSMATGLTAGSVLTVPFSHHDSLIDWRRGLAVWALTAAVAAVPWVALVRHDRTEKGTTTRLSVGDIARTRLGWLMAIFFGLQSIQAYSAFGWFALIYRDAGFDASTAGGYLGVITGMGIPLSFVISWLTARLTDQRLLIVATIACYPVGYLGLVYAPTSAPLLWAVSVGIGGCTFPLILTLIGLRARTPAGTAALSGFAQSIGYLVAAIGPFSVGVLHDVTGSWTTPLWALILLCIPQFLLGLAVARPVYVEDQLPAAGSR